MGLSAQSGGIGLKSMESSSLATGAKVHRWVRVLWKISSDCLSFLCEVENTVVN